jgi:hypothetical protein
MKVVQAKVHQHPGLNTRGQPLNAYMIFCRAQRPTVQAMYPPMRPIDHMIILAQIWRALPKKEKVVYEAMAAAGRRKSQYQKRERSHRKVRQDLSSASESTTLVRSVPIEKPNVGSFSLGLSFRWEMLLNHHDDEAE